MWTNVNNTYEWTPLGANNVAGTLVTLGETCLLRWALVSTTEGALHVRAVAKGRSTNKRSVLWTKPFESYELLYWCGDTRSGTLCGTLLGRYWNRSECEYYGFSPTTKTRAFCVAYPQRSCPTQQGGNHPRGRGRSPGKCVYIRVCVVGGVVRTQQHIFFTSCPMSFPTPIPTSWKKLPSNQNSKTP